MKGIYNQDITPINTYYSFIVFHDAIKVMSTFKFARVNHPLPPFESCVLDPINFTINTTLIEVKDFLHDIAMWNNDLEPFECRRWNPLMVLVVRCPENMSMAHGECKLEMDMY